MVGLAFLAVGLSHLLRPKGWYQFFAMLRRQGAPGAFINGMISLSFGVIIVGFHGTQWTGWQAGVTFVGWAQVFKGTLHICFPSYSLRMMGIVTEERAVRFAWAGALMIPAAGAILVASFRP